jgi:uncharacterized protein (DUF362 family)
MFLHVTADQADYPAPPFSPDSAYPEFGDQLCETDLTNSVYPLVRRLFRQLGWDAGNYGTERWNPLGHLVEDVDRVVIKPNLVLHKVSTTDCTIKSLVVHASVLRPLIDYFLLAAQKLQVDIEVVVADTPLQSCDFDRLCQQNGLGALMEHYETLGAPVRLLDLRSEWAVIDENFLIQSRVDLPGDPQGSTIIDLGQLSLHYGQDAGRAPISIQDYEDSVTRNHHSGEIQEYRFSNTVLHSELLVNVAKLKTHGKAGVTLAMKNIVGANTSKDFLPHFRVGAPERGGDEFARFSRYQLIVRSVRDFINKRMAGKSIPLLGKLKTLVQDVETAKARAGRGGIFAGAWWGNDTVWRTIVDINRAVVFGTRRGLVVESPQRRMICFLDGIWGMEGEGPIKGTDRYSGVIAYGDDPVEFDARSALLMGFDPARVPHISYWREADTHCVGEYPEGPAEVAEASAFQEPYGWNGRLRR